MVLSILIVDDSALSRKLTMRALPSGWDVNVSQACNGQEALDFFDRGIVDVMFLDLTMPVMTGYQVLETLRAGGVKCHVIVLSADIQPKAQQRAMQLGAKAFLRKPVKAQEVVSLLREFRGL